MERYETIIEKGKIVNWAAYFYIWGTPLIFLIIGTWGIYGINFTYTPVPVGKTEFYQTNTNIILTIVFSLFIPLCIYLLIRGDKILKLTFCKDTRSGIVKEKIIEKLAQNYKWKTTKTDKNYFLFWENNILLPSYYITIVYDENGFYINSYPYRDRIIDFGAGKKRSEEICLSIKGCL